MLERQTIDGRDATVAYLTKNFQPANRDTATLIKVIFDDGEVAFLTPQTEVEKYDPSEPRDEKGMWTTGGGGGGDATKPQTHSGRVGHGYSSSAYVDASGTIHTSNVDDAVRALYENKKVELNQPRQVSTLIDRLGEVSQRMIKMGDEAPNFNLCNVSVPGTNLFCAGNLGIPRPKMPQLNDEQTKQFRKYLEDKGYKISKEEESPAHLRATQNELNGAKVARMAQKIQAGEDTGKRLIISKDNYVLDGHHHWAARVGLDAADGKFTQSMKVARVNVGITQLLKEAKTFGAATESVNKQKLVWVEIYAPPEVDL